MKKVVLFLIALTIVGFLQAQKYGDSKETFTKKIKKTHSWYTDKQIEDAYNEYKLQEYLKAAKKGDVKAMELAGVTYHDDKKDAKNALIWFTKAAQADYALCQRYLGHIYLTKQVTPLGYKFPVEIDYKKALSWYSKSADNGDTMAQRLMKFHRSMEPYYKAASAGDTAAMLYIGNVKPAWYHIFFLFQNYWNIKAAERGCYMALKSEAVRYSKISDKKKYYTIAINNGYVGAMRLMAEVCYDEKDYQDAVRWYKQAAQKGDVESQKTLGNLYSYGSRFTMKGNYVTVDKQEALKWYYMAVENGDDNIKRSVYYEIAKIYALGGNGVEPDMDKTIEAFTKAANLNNYRAQYILGTSSKKQQQKLYWLTRAANNSTLNGRYKEADYELMKYYSDLSHKNLDSALYYGYNAKKGFETEDFNTILAQILQEKVDSTKVKRIRVEINNTIAKLTKEKNELDRFNYLKTHANDAASQLELAQIYEKGNSAVKKDINQAIKWYKLSFENETSHYNSAGYYLARIYYYGTEVPKNRKLARKYAAPMHSSRGSFSSNNGTPEMKELDAIMGWPLNYHDKEVGIYIGYIQRDLLSDSSGTLFRSNDFMNEGKWMRGFQLGLHASPSFKWGLGFHTGLFWQMLFEKDSEAQQDHYDRFRESALYLPLDVSFRIPFSTTCALYLRGGIGTTLTLRGVFSYSGSGDVPNSKYKDYGEEGCLHRFSPALQAGAELRFRYVSYQVNYQVGIRNMNFSDSWTTRFETISFGINIMPD